MHAGYGEPTLLGNGMVGESQNTSFIQNSSFPGMLNISNHCYMEDWQLSQVWFPAKRIAHLYSAALPYSSPQSTDLTVTMPFSERIHRLKPSNPWGQKPWHIANFVNSQTFHPVGKRDHSLTDPTELNSDSSPKTLAQVVLGPTWDRWPHMAGLASRTLSQVLASADPL